MLKSTGRIAARHRENDLQGHVATLLCPGRSYGLELTRNSALMLTIDPDKVCYIIVQARVVDAKVDPGDGDESSNMIDDDMVEILEDRDDDATREELTGFINELNEDEQVELVALAWVGRGSFSKSEWNDAVGEARRAHNDRTAEYLLGLPLLADYLAEGLAEFGHTCDE